jgi:hypothetical protein
MSVAELFNPAMVYHASCISVVSKKELRIYGPPDSGAGREGRGPVIWGAGPVASAVGQSSPQDVGLRRNGTSPFGRAALGLLSSLGSRGALLSRNQASLSFSYLKAPSFPPRPFLSPNMCRMADMLRSLGSVIFVTSHPRTGCYSPLLTFTKARPYWLL